MFNPKYRLWLNSFCFGLTLLWSTGAMPGGARAGQAEDYGLIKTCYVGKETRLRAFLDEALEPELGDVILANARQLGRKARGGACGIAFLQTSCDLILVFGGTRRSDAIIGVSAPDGPMPFTRSAVGLLASIGQRPGAVVIHRANEVDDPELLELVTNEIRELVSKSGFKGDALPVCQCKPECGPPAGQ